MKKPNLYYLIFLCSWASLLLSDIAMAHTENSEGYSTVTVKENEIRYELYIDYFELGRIVDLGVNPGVSMHELRAALRNNKEAAVRYLESNLQIYLDGEMMEGEIKDTNVTKKADREYAYFVFNFPASQAPSSSVMIRYSVLFDDSDPMHRNILSYQMGDKNGQFIFNNEERELKVGSGTILGQFIRFVQLGMHHILIGYDHLLFIFALVLGANKTIDIIKMATMFTLAHSLTLGLSALNLISISPHIVEPLIALSIAYVAIESFIFPELKYRMPVVFGFGLIHGIGFAGALQLAGDFSWKTFLSIFSFNVGVEAGQIFVILLLFPMLLIVRRYRWSAIIHGTANAGIFTFGLMWYFQRFLG